VARRLGETPHHLYAAPAYLELRGTPRALADLARHDVVLGRLGPTRWELNGPSGAEAVEVNGVVASEQLGFLVDAARAGLGISLLPEFAVRVHVANGVLVQVLPKYSTSVAMHVLTHATRRLPHRVALLRDFLALHLQGACTKHC
jgi:DNA-binding transcriptional LysR family regulator